MARRERRAPDPSRSPLAQLEAEIRAIDRKRRAADLSPSDTETRRFQSRSQVKPGVWIDLERAA
jgi:hypothetical protein